MLLYRNNPRKAMPWLLSLIRFGRHIPGLPALNRLAFRKRLPGLARTVFGIDFPGTVGLGDGVDINGEFYNDFADFGLGFVEIGPLPLAPEGRHVRGVRHAIAHLQKFPPKVPILANLAMGKGSSDEPKIKKDFSTAFSLMYDFADVFVINTSHQHLSGGASSLDDISFLSEILDELLSLRLLNDKYKPILIQIPSFLEPESLDRILDYALISGIDGIVAQGAPAVRHIVEYTTGRLPVIARDENVTPEKAVELLAAGAELIELTHELVRSGPGAVRRINERILL